jgi:hypothetical protein
MVDLRNHLAGISPISCAAQVRASRHRRRSSEYPFPPTSLNCPGTAEWAVWRRIGLVQTAISSISICQPSEAIIFGLEIETQYGLPASFVAARTISSVMIPYGRRHRPMQPVWLKLCNVSTSVAGSNAAFVSG